MNAFDEKFGAELSSGTRWAAFSWIYEYLRNLGRPISIVETGTARQRGNYQGDGQSTILFDWMLQEFGGTGISIDLSLDAVGVARSQVQRMTVIHGDSITILRGLSDLDRVDLVYLDSYDWTGGWDAALHHAGELSAIFSRLSPGCVIAVDDCLSRTNGKHMLVSAMLREMGMTPVLESYITIWIKS